MTRSIFLIALALAVVAHTRVASADDPTPAQLDKAKKAFGEGKKAFDASDFPEAAAKFKESYNLSKKPALLYNIGLANESGGQDDIALFYYRKFLTDAPADAPQRAEVADRVKALEKKFGGGNSTAEPTKTEPVKTEPAKAEPAKPLVIKPAGTYSATDFQHQVIDSAPPAKPLDITAFVPEDSGWTVTLYFRTAGEGKFTSKAMKWRYKELVGRVPPTKMIGNSIQYYIEVKDQAGAVVSRAGKSTSPNLVNLEAGVAPRFYPDFSDDGTVQTAAQTKAEDEDEDPLSGKKKSHPKVANPDAIEIQPVVTGPQNGFADVGSSKFKGAKWTSTGIAVAGIGLGVVFFIQAGSQAKALADDTKMCGAPPCRSFDTYDKDLEAAGKRDQTLSNVGFVVGGISAVVAGYFWYKELTAKKRGDLKVSGGKAPSQEAASWVLAPSVSDGFAGAAALGRF